MPSSPALALREAILDGLDPHLEEMGFRRRKPSFEWFRQPVPGVTHGIHLNFGPTRTSRLVIIPTVAAGIEAVERELAAAGLKGSARNGCSFSYQLHTLLECEYVASTDEGAEPMVNRLVADIRRHGLSRLERLSSLETVARLMLSAERKDWPVTFLSMRARLVPLVLALLGRTQEAHVHPARLRADVASNDQLRPGIDKFATWFVGRFGQAA